MANLYSEGMICPGFSGYLFYPDGSIFSLYRLKYKSIHYDRFSGYYKTRLKHDKKRLTTRFVHILVATAFFGERLGGCCVNHKDGNKLNNNVSNLEFITYSQNTLHAIELGLRSYYCPFCDKSLMKCECGIIEDATF